MREKEAYPTFIKKEGEDYLVYVPGFEIYTEGESFPDAIASARDAIGLSLVDAQDDGRPFPDPLSAEGALKKAKEEADDLFDYSDGILTYVDIDCVAYRNQLNNRAVRKNCTIPFWLNAEAERQGVNFSKVLQDALMQKLNVG